MSEPGPSEQGSGAPPWQIRGNPTPAELAAALTVLSALAAAAQPPPTATGRTSGGWSDYWRGLRRTMPGGRGAWWASGLPYA
jgi:hypothetical protein